MKYVVLQKDRLCGVKVGIYNDRFVKTFAGSGYPGDATSIKFLQQSCDPVFGFPSIARFSWSTAEDMLAKHHIKVEWCLESNKKAKGAMDMFVKKDPVPKENAFFTARSIQQVDEL